MVTSVDIFDSEMGSLSKQFPTAEVPPHCFRWMNAKPLAYESRSMLTIEVTVTEDMLNPMRVMQGGFITAAFDNAFGPLSYVAARNPCITLDMHTQFIRSIACGDTVRITVRVVSRGPVSLHLAGEAINRKGKLVATCTSNMILVK